MLEVQDNRVDFECCNCEERSTSSKDGDSPKRKEAEPPPYHEKENTDVTLIPSDLQSTPRTIPPPELFQGSHEVVVKINV